jgi:uncharacterized protein with HEPN domain
MNKNTETDVLIEILEAIKTLGLFVTDIHYETFHEACGIQNAEITGCIHIRISTLPILEGKGPTLC